nr:metalloregulator ArsR/SmtB family transcription factor [uncultured Peptostreptococcus sp.]
MEELSVSSESLVTYAEVLKAIAHPARLCIVKTLVNKGPSNVSNMYVCLELAQSTVSQHLSKLRSAGIIRGERNGTEIVYSVDNDFAEIIVKAMKV